MDYEVLSFLKDIHKHVDPAYKEHTLGAVNWYAEHGSLSAGYLKSVKASAFVQGKMMPDALLTQFERENPQSPTPVEKHSLLIEVSLDMDADTLDATANLVRKLAMHKRRQA